MTWREARAALHRLVVDLRSCRDHTRDKPATKMDLAEFALTAHGFNGFQRLRRELAVKLRQELSAAAGTLAHYLSDTLRRVDEDI
jgi:hypothetical protein